LQILDKAEILANESSLAFLATASAVKKKMFLTLMPGQVASRN
jgi:hypothetical protein